MGRLPRRQSSSFRAPNHLGMGQNLATRGPQGLVVGSIFQVPFWVPIFDPHPLGKRERGLQAALDEAELFNGLMILNPNFRELHVAEQPDFLPPIAS